MPFPTAHALLIAPGTYAYAPQLNVPNIATDAGAVVVGRAFDTHVPVVYHEAAYGRAI